MGRAMLGSREELHRLLWSLYGISAVSHLVLLTFPNRVMLAAAVKCIPVLMLAVLVHTYAGDNRYQGGRVSPTWICRGLLFSVLGDFFLIDNELFLLGLAAFLVGHIFYI